MKTKKKSVKEKKKKSISKVIKAFLKRSRELEIQERNFRLKAMSGFQK